MLRVTVLVLSIACLLVAGELMACNDVCNMPAGNGCINNPSVPCGGPCVLLLYCYDVWQTLTTGVIFLGCNTGGGQNSACQWNNRITCAERECNCTYTTLTCNVGPVTGRAESHDLCTTV